MNDKRATIISDLGFGDAGKGSWTDYFARYDNAQLVVRYSGGPQAGHNVVTPGGKHHTFSQFGSGSFVYGVRTHLSEYMLVDPIRLMQERKNLQEKTGLDPLNFLSIDENCLVITPFHKAANRIREFYRGNNKHGSCGMGIGETVSDSITNPGYSIRVKDLYSHKILTSKLAEIRKNKIDELKILSNMTSDSSVAKIWNDLDIFFDHLEIPDLVNYYVNTNNILNVVNFDYFHDLLYNTEHTVFEGAQGVLLDQWNGFHPHTTWSTTTSENALTLLNKANFNGDVKTLGLMRPYAHRHGVGPLPTESTQLSNVLSLQEIDNPANIHQGAFRYGHLDLTLLKYAVDVSPKIDYLVISHLDQLTNPKLNFWISNTYGKNYNGIGYQDAALIQYREPGVVQENMTQRLKSIKPIGYSHYNTQEPDGMTKLLENISNFLEAPLGYVSYGRTADDKQKLI